MNLKYILLNESSRLHVLFHLYGILERAKLYRKIIDQFFFACFVFAQAWEREDS